MKAWNRNVALIYYDSSTSSFVQDLFYAYRLLRTPKNFCLLQSYIYGYLLCLKLKYIILNYLLIYYNNNKSITYQYKLHIFMKKLIMCLQKQFSQRVHWLLLLQTSSTPA